MIYGHNKTIHGTTQLDVEVHCGHVVAVWFRCMPLPFQQCDARESRALDMERMYKGMSVRRLVAVELLTPEESPETGQDESPHDVGGEG